MKGLILSMTENAIKTAEKNIYAENKKIISLHPDKTFNELLSAGKIKQKQLSNKAITLKGTEMTNE